MFESVNTKYLIFVTGILGAIAWIATILSGMYMFGRVGLGNIVIIISVGWIVATILTTVFLKNRANVGLVNLVVWKLWLVLSILGCLVNILAGVMMEVEVYPVIAYDYGVILPWLIIYSVGYLFTGLYDLDNKALSNRERLVYIAIGVISGFLAIYLFLVPSLYTEMIIFLTVLTLSQMITIFFRS